MAKRLRQKLHSFCSLRTEVFSARGISNLFKNQSSTRKFVAFYTLFVSASMVPFPRRGHEKLPYISPNFSPAAKNLAPARAEHGNGGRKNRNSSRRFEKLWKPSFIPRQNLQGKKIPVSADDWLGDPLASVWRGAADTPTIANTKCFFLVIMITHIIYYFLFAWKPVFRALPNLISNNSTWDGYVCFNSV
jgi:hypothetical protein